MSVEIVKNEVEHSLFVKARRELRLTGALRLLSFDENYVLISTAQGDVEISGQNMQVEGFDPDAGCVLVSGEVCGINYIDESPKKKKKLWG
jgi:sporulation protein YabP